MSRHGLHATPHWATGWPLDLITDSTAAPNSNILECAPSIEVGSDHSQRIQAEIHAQSFVLQPRNHNSVIKTLASENVPFHQGWTLCDAVGVQMGGRGAVVASQRRAVDWLVLVLVQVLVLVLA